MVVNMKTIIHLFGVFLQIQLSTSNIKSCPEAIKSVEIVSSCPDSKEDWDIAARRKNCSEIATRQNCSKVKDFKYHCVIDGYREKLVEVCAPKRIIFGHCVEFNIGGGVIQDQTASPCSKTFPKCNDTYDSTEAYKYPDCYSLVSISETTTDSTSTVGESDKGEEHKESNNFGVTIGIVSTAAVGTILVIIVVFLKFKKRLPSTTPTVGESTGLMSTNTENEENCSDKEDEDTVDETSLHYKKPKRVRRQRSSYSESSSDNYIDVKKEEQREDESKDTSNRYEFSGTTKPYRRRAISLSYDDDATNLEDKFEEKETFPYYHRKTQRAMEPKVQLD